MRLRPLLQFIGLLPSAPELIFHAAALKAPQGYLTTPCALSEAEKKDLVSAWKLACEQGINFCDGERLILKAGKLFPAAAHRSAA